jgi:methionine aminotransferase
MVSIKSKLPGSATTIFTVMSALAAECGAINLGQGFPDFMMSERLISLVDQAMRKGYNQYVHANGLPLLRERIAEKIADLYGAAVHPEQSITLTPGGTYAIYTALTASLQPGDEVIVFEPAYDSYIPNIEINGAKAVRIPLSFPEYRIDWNRVKNAVSPRTRMILLNSPHNPTGSVLGTDDMQALRGIVQGTPILLLGDEVYEHLIFDGMRHESLLRYPELLERSFVCFSFGKTYHCTGWKTGYCVAPPELMVEFRKVHQFNCFTCNSPMQWALAEFLKEKDEYLQLGKQVQRKRDYFEGLMRTTQFRPLPTHGSYFQLYSYADRSDMPEAEMAVHLTRHHGVATIPASAFYRDGTDNKVLRFCFVKKESTLEQAAERLMKF